MQQLVVRGLQQCAIVGLFWVRLLWVKKDRPGQKTDRHRLLDLCALAPLAYKLPAAGNGLQKSLPTPRILCSFGRPGPAAVCSSHGLCLGVYLSGCGKLTKDRSDRETAADK